jgi:nucleoside-triphosphatase THEP1
MRRGNMIAILTGDKLAGKTTLLFELVRTIPDCAGVLSRRIVGEDKEKAKGYEITCLPSMETAILGDDTESGASVKFCHFYFHSDSVKKAIDSIVATKESSLLLVDEIGFLELEGNGYAPAANFIKSRKGNTILSVRKDAVPILVQAWGITPAIIADVGKLGKETTTAIIKKALNL